jgi:site-specific DNA recombinase
MKRAVIYCRTATVSEGSALALLAQREHCMSYCQRQGYEVVEVLVDEGQSGVRLDRPGLVRVRELVQAGSVDALVIFQRDRLSRQVSHLSLLYREFSDASVALLVVSELDSEV